MIMIVDEIMTWCNLQRRQSRATLSRRWVPSYVCNLPRLAHLDVSDCKIVRLHPYIVRLPPPPPPPPNTHTHTPTAPPTTRTHWRVRTNIHIIAVQHVFLVATLAAARRADSESVSH